FAAGVTSQTITVAVLGDNLDEANETVLVNLSNPVGAQLGTAQGTLTINDNDASPNLSINSLSVAEGDTGTQNVTLTVTLSAVSGQNVTVDYATSGGTATAPADYAAVNGTLTFAPGVTTQSVVVVVAGDLLDEANETINVGLTNAVNAGITTATGVITI